MNIDKWFEQYDKAYSEFKWFIEHYFPGDIDALEYLRQEKKYVKMRNLLNDIWFKLPDNKFNIMENPKGWSEFLNLIED